MKHGIICSVPHLSDFAILSRFHLILPHLFKEYPEYKDFYHDRSLNGDFVMMDNSFFELHEKGEALTPEFLIEEANSIRCNEVVAPEVFLDSEKSLIALEEFLLISDKMKSRVDIAAVCQGSSLKDMTDYFLHLNKMYKEDISCIAIPFALDFETPLTKYLRSKTLKRTLNRILLIDNINNHLPEDDHEVIDVHLLGLSDPVELQTYQDIPWIRSNDSSCAFMHGKNGISIIPRGLPTEKISAKVDFGETIIKPESINLIHKNIQTILSFCE
jgi:hypothetical protein